MRASGRSSGNPGESTTKCVGVAPARGQNEKTSSIGRHRSRIPHGHRLNNPRRGGRRRQSRPLPLRRGHRRRHRARRRRRRARRREREPAWRLSRPESRRPRRPSTVCVLMRGSSLSLSCEPLAQPTSRLTARCYAAPAAAVRAGGRDGRRSRQFRPGRPGPGYLWGTQSSSP